VSSSNCETTDTGREKFLVYDPAYSLGSLLDAAEKVGRVDAGGQYTDEATALRVRLVEDLHQGHGVERVLPGLKPWPAARLVEVCLDQELRIGLEIGEIDRLRTEDTAAFIVRLVTAMPAEEQSFLGKALDAVNPTYRNILLRRLSGESAQHRPGKNGLSAHMDKHMRQKFNKNGYPYLRLREHATAFFPESRHSIFENCQASLPAIEQECGQLARRLTPRSRDFDHIALSLFNAAVPSVQVVEILRYLNAGTLSVPQAYSEMFGRTLDAYRIKSHKRDKPLQKNLAEALPEVEQFIQKALADMPETGSPSSDREEDLKHVKIVQAGQWAEMRLAKPNLSAALLRECGYSSRIGEATKEELQAIAHESCAVFATLLRRHMPFVEPMGVRLNNALGNNLTESEVRLICAKALYRAIIRFNFDDSSGYRVLWEAPSRAHTMLKREIFKRANLTDRVGAFWMSIEGARYRLAQRLDRSPTLEEIAGDRGVTVEELHNIDRRVRSALGLPLG
jgi:hypothetical protein